MTGAISAAALSPSNGRRPASISEMPSVNREEFAAVAAGI